MKQEYLLPRKRVYIRCIHGCIQRNLDAKKIGTYLSINNYCIVDDPLLADYIIFFSCGATDSQVKYSLKDIKKFQKFNAELIVSGCVPDIAPEKLQKIFSGTTISPKKLEQIDDIFPDNKIKLNTINEQHTKWLSIAHTEGIGRHLEFIKKITTKIPISKYFFIFIKKHVLKPFLSEMVLRITPRDIGYIISISRGCIHNCSYCGIRKGIGPLISKPLNQCIKEFMEGLQKKNTQFVITADDIGPYGIDIGSSLPELLNEITKIPGDYTIKITGTHPGWIIKYI
ncbi:MAG: hypothetical protein KKC68_03705, partial [Candidatus Thermoplasmatota archaeon]|nr:hypothetical protein [Candidatus Thermoplasmatota archaeon]